MLGGRGVREDGGGNETLRSEVGVGVSSTAEVWGWWDWRAAIWACWARIMLRRRFCWTVVSWVGVVGIVDCECM